MNEFTLYFLEESEKTIIWDFNGVKIKNNYYKKILKEICEKEVTTLNARIEIVKKITKRRNNVPLYINHQLLFFKIKATPNIWINYFNVLKYEPENEKTRVIFKKGTTLLINKRIKYLKKTIRMIKKITFYTQKK